MRTSINYRIETLCFHNQDSKDRFTLEDLRKLVLKMKETMLVDSLKSLSVHDKKDKAMIRAILNEWGFGNVNVVEETQSA